MRIKNLCKIFAAALGIASLSLLLSPSLHANPFVSGRPSEVTAGFLGFMPMPFLQQIMALQTAIHQIITERIEALKEGHSFEALWSLLMFSFAYGVFHVLAPGHGKVIVGSYFLGNNAKWKEGVWAGFLMALGHTITAVGIVAVLALVFGLGELVVEADAQYMELIGYGLIAVIGLWLLVRAIRNAPECSKCGHDHHGHAYGHSHAHGEGHVHDAVSDEDDAHHLHRDHDHTHNHEHANHEHAPDQAHIGLQKPQEDVLTSDHEHTSDLIQRPSTRLFAAASLVPCTGSMIILMFTLANDVLWAGVLAVIMIALGMWLTITAIGLASMLLRRALVGDETHPGPTRQKFMKAARILAALVVTLTGCLLFAGTYYGLSGGGN